jgi:hypothetical protein
VNAGVTRIQHQRARELGSPAQIDELAQVIDRLGQRLGRLVVDRQPALGLVEQQHRALPAQPRHQLHQRAQHAEPVVVGRHLVHPGELGLGQRDVLAAQPRAEPPRARLVAVEHGPREPGHRVAERVPRQRRPRDRRVDPRAGLVPAVVGHALLDGQPDHIVEPARRLAGAARRLDALRDRAIHRERAVERALLGRDRHQHGQHRAPPRQVAHAVQEVRLARAVRPLHQLEARSLGGADQILQVRRLDHVKVRLVAGVDVADADLGRFSVLAHLRQDAPRLQSIELVAGRRAPRRSGRGCLRHERTSCAIRRND